MSHQSRFTIENDEFEIIKATKEHYEDIWNFFLEHFMAFENVSIATNLLEEKSSIDEMRTLLNACLDDGVSFVARQISTKAIVGLSANKILNATGTCSLKSQFTNFKTSNLAAVEKFLERMENSFNLFEEWNIDCVLEIVFLSTHKNFGKRGIAFNLAHHTIVYAKNLLHHKLSEKELLELPSWVNSEKPRAICSTFTSLFTQKIGKKLNFEIVNKVSNSEFSYENKTFAEKISPIHEFSIYAALKLL